MSDKDITIFDKINQVAILANDVRLKIMIALFNSEFVKFNNIKLGTNSHTSEELQQIFNINTEELHFHLDLLSNMSLIMEDKEMKKCYHITDNGKKIMEEFGLNKKIVQEETSKITAS